VQRMRFTQRMLRNALRLRDWRFGRALTVAGVSPRGLSVAGDALRVDELGISISRDNSSLIARIPDAFLLNRELGVQFSNGADGVIAVSDGFKLHIDSGEEVFILREILWEGIYDFGMPAEDIVVWDIGMNVGIASLYFATRSRVRAVLGFEPFQPTFHSAKRNLDLNPTLASKIKPQNCGIAGRAYAVQTEYSSTWKGSVGVGGIRKEVLDLARLGGDQIAVERVELLAADGALRSILKAYPNCSVVAKIDCEGSEYEIIRCLHDSRLLGELSAVMLEWHQHGPRELEQTLQDAGFATFSPSSHGERGMIYAARLRDN
jgi:FkbM family methyltransferase